MAKHQLISSGYIIGKVHRDFAPSVKGWHQNAIEWIGEALGIMNMVGGMTTTTCKAQVSNFRLKIPCPIETFHGVTYCGQKLTLLNGFVMPAKVTQLLGETKIHPNAHYQINPNWLHFSFQEGEVELF